jgi:hypothetical protein
LLEAESCAELGALGKADYEPWVYKLPLIESTSSNDLLDPELCQDGNVFAWRQEVGRKSAALRQSLARKEFCGVGAFRLIPLFVLSACSALNISGVPDLQYAIFSGVLVWLNRIREFKVETVHPTGVLRLHERYEVRWGENQISL